MPTVVDLNKCSGCGKCVSDCVAKNIDIVDGKAHMNANCFLCGHCVAICPGGAVSIPEYDMDEVVEYNGDNFLFSPDNFLNAVKFRRSIRNFDNKKIERDKLEKLISAGKHTETGGNIQGVQFIVVQEELKKAKALIWAGLKNFIDENKDNTRLQFFQQYYDAYKENPENDRLFFNAPAFILLASDSLIDAGLAAANMEMLAVAMGLGVMFDGYVVRAVEASPEAKNWLGLEKKTAACMLIGYPDVAYKRTAPRRKANVLWK